MIIPVRCFSCGKVVGHLWAQYQALLAAMVPAGYASFLEALLSPLFLTSIT